MSAVLRLAADGRGRRRARRPRRGLRRRRRSRACAPTCSTSSASPATQQRVRPPAQLVPRRRRRAAPWPADPAGDGVHRGRPRAPASAPSGIGDADALPRARGRRHGRLRRPVHGPGARPGRCPPPLRDARRRAAARGTTATSPPTPARLIVVRMLANLKCLLRAARRPRRARPGRPDARGDPRARADRRRPKRCALAAVLQLTHDRPRDQALARADDQGHRGRRRGARRRVAGVHAATGSARSASRSRS